jgi:FkbM family methyltransferase
MLSQIARRLARFLRTNPSTTPVPKGFERLSTLFALYGVDYVVDVGANAGQTAIELRKSGFSGPILSLEPIKYLYEQMSLLSEADPKWTALRCAAGRTKETAHINVSGGHAGASSIRTMTNNVLRYAPDQAPVRKEEISIVPLTEILGIHYPQGNRCFLKIDVQGFENEVLDGALDIIDRVVGLQMEMSIVRNYEGESLLYELLPKVQELGFKLVGVEEAWGHAKTREIFQLDVRLFRTERAVT